MTDDLLREELEALGAAVRSMDQGFRELPDAGAMSDPRVARILLETAERLRDNFPYQHPLYAGQMLKPPHPVARLAYALAQRINPNNHALDGGRASSRMEREAVARIAAMFGWDEPGFLGHLCGGGTMANLEALWVAGRLHPGGAVVASSQAHYTHGRISAVLGLPFESVPCDALGRMDTGALARRLERGGVAAVVATLGTTATGSVDPLPEILETARRSDARVHVDAAYGGYFALASNLDAPARAAFDRIADADSIVVDPHKHGLQPYGCGCVLFRDPSVGRLYKHDSPYTYFTSDELHLGEISLECSRAGASAVALWATQRLLPPVAGGEFARGLESGRAAALALHERVATDRRFVRGLRPELDIVVWLPRAPSARAASELSRRVFDEAERRGLYLAVAQLPAEFFALAEAGVARDADTVACLRSVLMKPEHADWVDEIWKRLGDAVDAVNAG
ncbi:MAG TPA: aminotransferase class I/II-fold pyridoxal phosphate-dependent enzyme [Thermoanaerobaculia bacterium]|nr:aminotransferase class I/II-fold pyridoxal phosphate-dependent enzyme [Thermoanaerobaculia bacterium]